MSQSISHVLIAACVVQVVVRLWRVHEPDLRVAFRVLPLAFPAVVLPAFFVLAPWRTGEAFRDGAALFVGSRWAAVTILGVQVNRVVFGSFVAVGVVLLLVDVVRIVAERRRGIAGIPRMPARETAAIVHEVAALARAVGARIPTVTALDTGAPMLFVSGVRRPVLVVSRGVLERLDARERQAALAHEIAHVARGDALTGWALLACRVALLFNPAAQIVARAAVRELEWRADELAVRASGDRDALVSALAKLARGGARPSTAAPARPLLTRLANDVLRRGRRAAIAGRRQRLRQARGGAGSRFGMLRLAGTGGGLVLLLFFVV